MHMGNPNILHDFLTIERVYGEACQNFALRSFGCLDFYVYKEIAALWETLTKSIFECIFVLLFVCLFCQPLLRVKCTPLGQECSLCYGC